MQAGAAPSWAPCSAPALGSVRSRIAQTDVPALHLLWIVLKDRQFWQGNVLQFGDAAR